MALDRSVLVPRPEHGTVLKTVSGKTYVYYATAVYRNEKGQPMQCPVMDYGVFYVFMAIAEKLGLTAILKKYFPDEQQAHRLHHYPVP